MDAWTVTFDTADLPDHVNLDTAGRQLGAGEHLKVQAWSMVLLQRLREEPAVTRKRGKLMECSLERSRC